MTAPLNDTDPLLLDQLDRCTPLARQALIIAHAEIGVAEVPPGSNNGPRVSMYQVGIYEDAPYLIGARWCARFARWCFESAARALGEPPPFKGWGDLASALKWFERSKSHGKWTPAAAPGRVGLLLRPDHTGHVMMVAKVEGVNCVTIEGNETDRVAVRRRESAYFTGGFVDLG